MHALAFATFAVLDVAPMLTRPAPQSAPLGISRQAVAMPPLVAYVSGIADVQAPQWTPHEDPTGCFPWSLVPRWAPQPNAAARVADSALVVISALIFYPAFTMMKAVCAVSRPLDTLASAGTHRYIEWAQRARRERRLRQAAAPPTADVMKRAGMGTVALAALLHCRCVAVQRFAAGERT